jgi:hypothetical protein
MQNMFQNMKIPAVAERFEGGHTLIHWGGPARVRSQPTPTHKTCLLSAVGDLK